MQGMVPCILKRNMSHNMGKHIQEHTPKNAYGTDEDDAREFPSARAETEICKVPNTSNIAFERCDGDVEVDTPCCAIKISKANKKRKA